MKHGKKYVDSAKLVDRSKFYETDEALDLCVKTGKAKFDETPLGEHPARPEHQNMTFMNLN